jgi:hypothetical protein
MNIRSKILEEHSKAQTTKIVKFIGKNPRRFKKLVDVFLGGPYRVTQRAAWPISVIAEKEPQLIRPHLRKILNFARKRGVHDSVKRNAVRLLQFIEIPRSLHGNVADLCFSFLTDKNESIAVKCFSMSALASVAESNPGINSELRLIIEDQLPYASAGFRSRARRVIKQISDSPQQFRT